MPSEIIFINTSDYVYSAPTPVVYTCAMGLSIYQNQVNSSLSGISVINLLNEGGAANSFFAEAELPVGQTSNGTGIYKESVYTAFSGMDAGEERISITPSGGEISKGETLTVLVETIDSILASASGDC